MALMKQFHGCELVLLVLAALFPAVATADTTDPVQSSSKSSVGDSARQIADTAKKDLGKAREKLSDMSQADVEEAKRKVTEIRALRDSIHSGAERVREMYYDVARFPASTSPIDQLDDLSEKADRIRAEIRTLTTKVEEAGAALYDTGEFEGDQAENEFRRRRRVLDQARLELDDKQQELGALEARQASTRKRVMASTKEEADALKALQDVLKDVDLTARDAQTVYSEAQELESRVRRQEAASDALCGEADGGGEPRRLCFVFGLFTAALSRVVVSGEDGTGALSPYFGGRTSRQLAAAAIPATAARVVPIDSAPYVSIDLGVYSAFLSPRLETASTQSSSTSKTSCSSTAGNFEKNLPCQANAPLNPYAAFYLGATFGKENVGYVSFLPITLGLGTVGDSKKMTSFYGWTLGMVQLNGTLP